MKSFSSMQCQYLSTSTVLSEYSSTCIQWILKYVYKYSVDTQVHVLSGYSSTCTCTQWILKYMYKYSVNTQVHV